MNNKYNSMDDDSSELKSIILLSSFRKNEHE